MKVSDECIELIAAHEGCELKPCRCPAGVPTIGFGNTRYEDGTPVKLGDPPITRERANTLMRAALAEYEAAVSRYVQVPLKQHQFDALVSFAYNVGAQNLRGSTLLGKLNRGDYEGAANEFHRWTLAAGKRLDGLARRRSSEANLFRGLFVRHVR